MKSHIDHILLFINYSNIDFYKQLLTFLGWEIFMEVEDEVGFKNNNMNLWIAGTTKKGKNNYDRIGMNHISFQVGQQKNVDEVAQILKAQNIEMLFGTPKHRPEYAIEKNGTYYQIMFETPDKILFEVVYIGANQ